MFSWGCDPSSYPTTCQVTGSSRWEWQPCSVPTLAFMEMSTLVVKCVTVRRQLGECTRGNWCAVDAAGWHVVIGSPCTGSHAGPLSPLYLARQWNFAPLLQSCVAALVHIYDDTCAWPGLALVSQSAHGQVNHAALSGDYHFTAHRTSSRFRNQSCCRQEEEIRSVVW